MSQPFKFSLHLSDLFLLFLNFLSLILNKLRVLFRGLVLLFLGRCFILFLSSSVSLVCHLKRLLGFLFRRALRKTKSMIATTSDSERLSLLESTQKYRLVLNSLLSSFPKLTLRVETPSKELTLFSKSYTMLKSTSNLLNVRKS